MKSMNCENWNEPPDLSSIWVIVLSSIFPNALSQNVSRFLPNWHRFFSEHLFLLADCCSTAVTLVGQGFRVRPSDQGRISSRARHRSSSPKTRPSDQGRSSSRARHKSSSRNAMFWQQIERRRSTRLDARSPIPSWVAPWGGSRREFEFERNVQCCFRAFSLNSSWR